MMERWDAAVVSTGDVLRVEIAAGSLLGKEAAQYMDHGRLVPDRVALAATASWLNDHQGSFVFDGFPRTVGQAEALQELLHRRGASLTAALWLELPLTRIQERVSKRVVCRDCGRSFQVGMHVASREQSCPACGGKLMVRHDDDPAKLANRMEQYRRHTEPVMHYYEEKGLLRRIKADGAPDEVLGWIEEALTTTPEEAMI